MRIVMITSSVSGEGKTTTAANLAVVLARAGRRVMLVDADLRKPQVHELFAVAQSPGLTEVLLGESVVMVANAADGGVDVITAGTAPANPSELLASERLRHALRELADSYDYVILDTAPILPVADSVAISRAADGVVLVAQANRVSRRHVSDALGRLGRVDANVFGIVLNRARVSGGYGYRYRYQTAGGQDRDSVASTDRAEADTVTATG